MSDPLLSVRDLVLRRDDGSGSAILHDFDLDVHEGEVVILKGPSGCGKTSLLKCIAELVVYQGGQVLLHGKPAREYGIPKYRTLVQYVPQRPSLLPGNPAEFLERIRSFGARKQAQPQQHAIDPVELAAQWGIDKVLWTRDWATLSGGEGQRIALAIAVGIGGAEVILLDEPTSALDEASMQQVEKSLLEMLPPQKTRPSSQGGVQRKGTGPKAFVWITHEASQADRVGTRTVDLSHT